VLTGLSMVIMDSLGAALGFGFSAGLFDFVLNYGMATRPWLLLPVGGAYFAIYYLVFRFCIVRFDLKTPGREAITGPSAMAPISADDRPGGLIRALGGAGNIETVDACTTRLRLRLIDNAAADEPALKALGARGVVRLGPGSLQVVLGPIADQVAGEIRDRLATGKGTAPSADPRVDAMLRALGGNDNIHVWRGRAGRLSVSLKDSTLGDPLALANATPRGAAFLSPTQAHLLPGPLFEELFVRLPAARRARTEGDDGLP